MQGPALNVYLDIDPGSDFGRALSASIAGREYLTITHFVFNNQRISLHRDELGWHWRCEGNSINYFAATDSLPDFIKLAGGTQKMILGSDMHDQMRYLSPRKIGKPGHDEVWGEVQPSLTDLGVIHVQACGKSVAAVRDMFNRLIGYNFVSPEEPSGGSQDNHDNVIRFPIERVRHPVN